MIRAICLYVARTWASNAVSSAPCARSALAGGPLVSMVRATVGRSRSALTFGALTAVQTTIAVPFHKNPMGITRGSPSVPVIGQPCWIRGVQEPRRVTT